MWWCSGRVSRVCGGAVSELVGCRGRVSRVCGGAEVSRVCGGAEVELVGCAVVQWWS